MRQDERPIPRENSALTIKGSGFTKVQAWSLLWFAAVAALGGLTQDHAVWWVLAPYLFILWFTQVRNRGLIRLSAAGITADLSSISWSNLHSVRLKDIPPSKLTRAKGSHLGKTLLIMDFDTGQSIPVNINHLSHRQLEDFFVYLARFANPLTLNPDVIALQKATLSGMDPNFAPSYTNLWEESLQDSFQVTSFVPLHTGCKLYNGKYTILILIACGGMSSVYLASDAGGKRLILKELATSLEEKDPISEKLQELFLREVGLLSKIDHPAIVKVLDCFVQDGRQYLALEFIAGLTIRQWVRLNGPLPQSRVIELGQKIADILAHLHELEPPVVHRDLTPDNLILREHDQEVVLIDFGAAFECIRQGTGTAIGKHCYMPLEQVQGHTSPLSDIFALGGTLYFMVTGNDPLPLSTLHPGAEWPNVSPALDQLIAKTTAQNPEDRFVTARALSDALRLLGTRPAIKLDTGNE
jgi:tRNA A-37 threonylcarbamoyl transferase component Bud32